MEISVVSRIEFRGMVPGIKISPSILAADFLHLEDQVALVLTGGCEYVHMDILDGKFAADISFGPRIVEQLAPMIHHAGAGVDVHLMIEEPERYVPRFVLAGADIVTIHVEASKDVQGTLKAIRIHGARAGLALRPKTPLLSIQAALPLANLVLVLSVEPGIKGQPFPDSSLARVRRIRELLDGLHSNAELEVEGGISAGNASAVAEAGADVLVAGESVFNAGMPVIEAIRALRGTMEKIPSKTQ
jgi:ribulose-phosphate 3-epimerase